MVAATAALAMKDTARVYSCDAQRIHQEVNQIAQWKRPIRGRDRAVIRAREFVISCCLETFYLTKL